MVADRAFFAERNAWQPGTTVVSMKKCGCGSSLLSRGSGNRRAVERLLLNVDERFHDRRSQRCST